MTTYFISGHLTVTREEFEEHYEPLLRAARQEGASFVVGDARGADTMCQEYLAGKASQVTVYHMFESPRNNKGKFPCQGGFQSDNARDKAMTGASDKDLAWVRPGREKSGTARNLKRRVKGVDHGE